MGRIRHESSVTAISWIPSEAIEGLSKVPFELGITHYDQPPPAKIDDLEVLRKADRFREANELRAFVDVEDGRIVEQGYLAGGQIGSTTVRLGPATGCPLSVRAGHPVAAAAFVPYASLRHRREGRVGRVIAGRPLQAAARVHPNVASRQLTAISVA